MLEIPTTLALQVSSDLQSASNETAQALGQELGISEWLGPLAPIALSPFFGLAALSGIATYGPEWMQHKSTLLQPGSSINSPALFWTMAALALLTSLLRMTKISKPIALAAEKLEAYSAIIILIVVRMTGAELPTDGVTDQASADPIMAAAGLSAITMNLALSLFAAINVFVINIVKLFCEFLIWLVPVPTIDAIVEAANKTLCASLMGLYCFSPMLASVVNIVLLLACLTVFAWVYRRLKLYQELIVSPMLVWIAPKWFGQKGREFNAFVEESQGALVRYSRVKVTIESEGQYRVRGSRWLIPFERMLSPASKVQPCSNRLLSQALSLEDEQGKKFVLVLRKWCPGDSLYEKALAAVQ